MAIKSFRFWCQKVLPLVYDDSLSYYELLCKVVATLNDVIDQTNTTQENFLVLQENFEKLKTYVKNYFDNLDVQEEINNKLDEMAASGELSDIILNVGYYKSAQQGWNVTRVKDSLTATQRYTTTQPTEALLNENGEVIGYLGPYETKMLPAPMAEAVLTGSIDSYLGTLVNVFVSNKTLAKYRQFFVDKTAGPSGTQITTVVQLNVTGKHETPPDTPKYGIYSNRAQAVNIAKSYYEARLNGRKFGYGANFITYANSDRVNDGKGRAMMECDTFVALVMMGIPYNRSPYSNETPSYTYVFDDLVENPDNLTWCLPWKYNGVVGRKVTYTGAQNWYLWYNSLVYKNYANLSSGDIIIFTKKDTKYFDGVKHIGIANIEVVDGVNTPYIYHVTGLYGVESPMMYEPLSNVLQRGGYNLEKDVYFARPNYA